MPSVTPLADVLGLTIAQRLESDVRQSAERAFGLEPVVGEAPRIRVYKNRDGFGRALWRWSHDRCGKYLPGGVPADFYGNAVDQPTALAYARRHAWAMHGVRI